MEKARVLAGEKPMEQTKKKKNDGVQCCIHYTVNGESHTKHFEFKTRELFDSETPKYNVDFTKAWINTTIKNGIDKKTIQSVKVFERDTWVETSKFFK